MTMTFVTSYHQGSDEADVDREMEAIIAKVVRGEGTPADVQRYEQLLARREAMLSPPAVRRVGSAAANFRKYAI